MSVSHVQFRLSPTLIVISSDVTPFMAIVQRLHQLRHITVDTLEQRMYVYRFYKVNYHKIGSIGILSFGLTHISRTQYHFYNTNTV